MSKLPKSFVHLSNIKTNPLIKEGFIVFQIVPKREVRFRHFPQGRGGKIGGLFLKGEWGTLSLTFILPTYLLLRWVLCTLLLYTISLSIFCVSGKELSWPFQKRCVITHKHTCTCTKVFKCVINHTGKWIFWLHVFPT